MSGTNPDISSQGPAGRRALLKGLWLSLWAGLVATAGLGLGALLKLAGAGGAASPPAPVSFGPKELPGPGQVRVKGRVALLRDADGLFALGLRCPHLGCRPDWDRRSRRFLCPCHGSAFAYDGRRLKGPADRGLAQVALERDAQGRLIAHPGRPAAPGARLRPGAA